MFPKEHPEFITITCLEWLHLLSTDSRKKLITDSLRFLARNERAIIYGFVVMINHLHLIWQFRGNHNGHNVIRDFLKYTSQQLLRNLAEENPQTYNLLRVDACDRKFQVWQRDSLRIPLWSNKVFNQKLDYIHWNPVKAGLCRYPEDYRYSSASFYITSQSEWEFLTHADD